jgi:hypothetical protein
MGPRERPFSFFVADHNRVITTMDWGRAGGRGRAAKEVCIGGV